MGEIPRLTNTLFQAFFTIHILLYINTQQKLRFEFASNSGKNSRKIRSFYSSGREAGGLAPQETRD